MKKKILSVLLAATMVTAMLSGCGSKAASSDTTAATEAANTAKASK